MPPPNGVWQSARMTIIDVRTRKLGDDRVEAVAITDAAEPDGSPVVVRGHGPTPEEAIADAKAKAEARVTLVSPDMKARDPSPDRT